ncbi:uncharacterized protein LOC131847893 [Achroia grisella]|uniref:uncharacterized protein LOC131847893 n=1 Tax=Achroia grisella TaxID=688607 RepID=UPI0027D23658|nr:uncharacterized protein LOC131847893 [Achroia grisella]
MSYPPPSGPPNHYAPYPGQQPASSTYYANPGSVTYVPTPVLMPVYPPQVAVVPQPQQPPNSTYVTNIYQQPPPEPVRVVEHAEDIEWVSASTTSFQHLRGRALQMDTSKYWIIRAHHERALIPGKLHRTMETANIPYGGRDVSVHNFEVLCAKPSAVRWLNSSHGMVPPGAIAAGYTESGEALYVAKANHVKSNHGRSLFSQIGNHILDIPIRSIPGKVHPSHKCCYISFLGMEISYQSYEVLCKMYD